MDVLVTEDQQDPGKISSDEENGVHLQRMRLSVNKGLREDFEVLHHVGVILLGTLEVLHLEEESVDLNLEGVLAFVLIGGHFCYLSRDY